VPFTVYIIEITHSHGSAKSVVWASQWENEKFDPLPRPNPLTDHHKKVAHVITSWISTDMQNLVTIPQGVSFPRMCEIAIKMFTRLLFGGKFFQRPTA